MIFIYLLTSTSQEKTTLSVEQQSLVQRVSDWRQKNQINVNESETPVKCALGLTFEILRNYQNLQVDQKILLKKLLQGPNRQAIRIAGHFTIHYDTVGYYDQNNYFNDNVPSLLTPSFSRMLGDTNYVKSHLDSINVINAFVDSTLIFFNYVWDKEVEAHGYLPPPFESGENTYNIYITELGGGLYGQTVTSPDPINPGHPVNEADRYTSYIEIDNDYISVYSTSRGLPGLKVTAAHEFHHAIQLGSYGYRYNDRYFYEVTSTWMEDFLYNDVNDYYQYIKYAGGQPRGHFANPDLSFIYSDGMIEYSRAIWGKFIQEKYTPTVMRNAWQNMINEGSVKALDDALINVGSTLRIAFVEFGKWNYYTGIRSIQGKYYSEAQNYPLIRQKTAIELIGNQRTYEDSTETFSSIYLPIMYKAQEVSDMITNINLNSLINYSIKKYRFNYQIATSGDETYRQLGNDAFVKLDVTDPVNWSLGGIITIFALPPTKEISTKLYIYNSGMEFVGSYDKEINPADPKINWTLIDKNGEIISSGIYIYVITLNKQEYTGKFAVIKK
jgi:hypothetical protein